MKKNYWVIIKNGFVGCRRFITEDDANDACESMNMLDPVGLCRALCAVNPHILIVRCITSNIKPLHFYFFML